MAIKGKTTEAKSGRRAGAGSIEQTGAGVKKGTGRKADAEAGKKTGRKAEAKNDVKAVRETLSEKSQKPGAEIKELISRLSEHYPDARTALDFTNPLEILVATILSAQCTDERVNIVTSKLFKKYRKAEDYYAVPQEELENDIRSTGFYRNKAKNIRGATRMIVERYKNSFPNMMETLLELPGVARKTANCVLSNAFGIAAGVVVDTHVLRLSARLGLTHEEDAEKVERDLMAQVPKEHWIHFSHWLINHGRAICKARKPMCRECFLNDICPSAEL
jgi:endonuclease-3